MNRQLHSHSLIGRPTAIEGRTLRRLLILVLTLLIAVPLASAASLDKIRTANRENLNRLSLGMSKEQVFEMMGTKTKKHYSSNFRINNPFKTEVLLSEDGDTALEVLFYYTDEKKADEVITDDELTPLVLKDGELIGWGQSFMTQAVQVYEIRMR